MARKQSPIEKFVQQCTAASPEELDLMFDILKGVRGKRVLVKTRGPNKVKPAPKAAPSEGAA